MNGIDFSITDYYTLCCKNNYIEMKFSLINFPAYGYNEQDNKQPGIP